MIQVRSHRHSTLQCAPGFYCSPLFCKHPLTSRVARWVIADPAGRRPGHPAGPTCARRHARRPEKRIPDFTRAAVEFPDEEHDAAAPEQAGSESKDGEAASASRASPGRRIAAPPGDDHRLVEYLRLRYEKLADFGGLGLNDRLDGIYYRTLGSRAAREPSEKGLPYVANLAAKLERRRSTLAPANLQACYAYGFWAEGYLRAGFHPTVAGILRSLRENLTLTGRQVDALNAFFANRAGFPRLDPRAFAGVARRVPVRR